MAVTIEEVKNNVAYKQLPIVILDERWHHLFPDKDKTPEIKTLEKNLADLMKKQGQITNDIKALKKIKADLMKEIIDNSETDDGKKDSKRQKIMERNQKLLMEANEKLENLLQEEVEIPGKIRAANIELVIEGVDVCYKRIHKNYTDIQLLGKWINEMRIELKKRVLIKQDKELKNTEIYSYMHDILGPDLIEIFDNKTKPENKSEKKSE